MTELRIIITDPDVGKTVSIHVVDAEAVLRKANAGSGPLEYISEDLAVMVANVLKNAEDTDKIEITPTGGIHYKATGEKVSFTL